MRQALTACQIPLENIPPEVVEKTLAELKHYSIKHQLPYGIAHELPGK
jgi:hypothetical protein